MKKTFKYIMLIAVGIVGMLQLSSCKKDGNEWSVDSSVTKQRPISTLKVEVDSTSLDITATLDTLNSAASYELQVSTSPLTSNDAIAPEGTVYTFDGSDGLTNQILATTECEFVIARDNGKFVVEQNTTYYFRVRAIGKDGTISNWYTNGMLYYGGVSNPTTEQKLIENTYCSLTTPATAWIDDANVESKSLTIRWIKAPDYATPTYLKMISPDGTETTKDLTTEQGVEDDPAYSKVKVQKYTWSGLEVDESYTFVLYAQDGATELSRVTKATEYDPVQKYSYFIGSFPALTTASKDTVLCAATPSGEIVVGDSTVTYKLIIGGQMKTESKSNTDNPFINPFDKSTFYPLTPGVSEKIKGNRISTGGSTSSMTITVPADGRLYFYAAGSGKIQITQGSEEEGTLKTTTITPPTSIASKSSNAFTKGYIEKGTATITWTASMYICGIHYVPWAEIVK